MRGSARMSVSDMRSKGNHECEHEQQDQGNAWTRVLAFYVHAKTFLCVWPHSSSFIPAPRMLHTLDNKKMLNAKPAIGISSPHTQYAFQS